MTTELDNWRSHVPVLQRVRNNYIPVNTLPRAQHLRRTSLIYIQCAIRRSLISRLLIRHHR